MAKQTSYERMREEYHDNHRMFQRVYPVGSVLKVREAGTDTDDSRRSLSGAGRRSRVADASARVESRCGISRYTHYAVRVFDHSVLELPLTISKDLSNQEIINTEGPHIHVKPMDDERPSVELLRPDRIIERID